MKKILFIFLISICSLSAREWTLKSGKVIEGDFIETTIDENTDIEYVHLEINGKKRKGKFSSFIKEDQDLIRQIENGELDEFGEPILDEVDWQNDKDFKKLFENNKAFEQLQAKGVMFILVVLFILLIFYFFISLLLSFLTMKILQIDFTLLRGVALFALLIISSLVSQFIAGLFVMYVDPYIGLAMNLIMAFGLRSLSWLLVTKESFGKSLLATVVEFAITLLLICLFGCFFTMLVPMLMGGASALN